MPCPAWGLYPISSPLKHPRSTKEQRLLPHWYGDRRGQAQYTSLVGNAFDIIKPARALIVDSSSSVRYYLSACLEQLGFTCVEAGDAFQALDMVEAQEFDLMLADVSMPGMSGVDLLSEIRDARPAMPIVMMSAYAHPQVYWDSVSAGADGFVTKLVTFDQLRQAIVEGFQTRSAYLAQLQP